MKIPSGQSTEYGHLKELFPNADHFSLEDSDYPHRAVVPRIEVAVFY